MKTSPQAAAPAAANAVEVAADRRRAEAAQSQIASADVLARLSSLAAGVSTDSGALDTLDAITTSLRVASGSTSPSTTSRLTSNVTKATPSVPSTAPATSPVPPSAGGASLKTVIAAYAEHASARAA